MLTRLRQAIRSFIRRRLGVDDAEAIALGVRRDLDALHAHVSSHHARIEKAERVALAAFHGLSDVDDRLCAHEDEIPRMRATRRKIDQARAAAELAARRPPEPPAPEVQTPTGPALVRDEPSDEAVPVPA